MSLVDLTWPSLCDASIKDLCLICVLYNCFNSSSSLLLYILSPDLIEYACHFCFAFHMSQIQISAWTPECKLLEKDFVLWV